MRNFLSLAIKLLKFDLDVDILVDAVWYPAETYKVPDDLN